jgi:hypothetical protein
MPSCGDICRHPRHTGQLPFELYFLGCTEWYQARHTQVGKIITDFELECKRPTNFGVIEGMVDGLPDGCSCSLEQERL